MKEWKTARVRRQQNEKREAKILWNVAMEDPLYDLSITYE